MKRRPARNPSSAVAQNPVEGPVFVFPGPEGWEIWSESKEGGVQCVGPAESPARLKPAPGAVFCLPSRCVFSVPLWVREADSPPGRDQVSLRLEEKGLLGPNPESAVWDMEPIRSEAITGSEGEPESRQLEATAVLLPGFEDGWLVDTAGRHELAGRTQAAPRGVGGAVLRRELGRWVMDFYALGKWLHTQPLLARTLDGGAAVEILALLSQLDGEGILSGLNQLVIRDDQGNPVGDDFLGSVPCPCRIEPRMPPRLPPVPWNLEPPALVLHRQEQTASRQRKRSIRLACLAYGLVMAMATAVLAIPWVQLQVVGRKLAEIADPAARIENTAMIWREASAWLDPKSNALEILWQVSRPLVAPDPPQLEGVQLTVFDLKPGRLLLQGKAADLVKVQAYLDWLKSNSALAGFTWKNSQPRLAADGTATFSAEGLLPKAGQSAPEGEEGNPNENPSG